VLITGDIVDSATRKQMVEARTVIDRLAETNPVLIVPGNHDYAWMGNILRPDGWTNWVELLGEPLGWDRKGPGWMTETRSPAGINGLGIWETEQCVYMGVDSGDPQDKAVSARGYISETLADGLRVSLEKYAYQKTRIVFLHHHPFADGLFVKLNGSEHLMAALENNCELVLFGHEHKYGIWRNRRGIPLIVSSHKSTDRVLGGQLMITVIEITNVGTAEATLRHRLELL
jgi:predicted phosphodiesterase